LIINATLGADILPDDIDALRAARLSAEARAIGAEAMIVQLRLLTSRSCNSKNRKPMPPRHTPSRSRRKLGVRVRAENSKLVKLG